ncbi:MAG: DUF4303 domain-containing protein [Oscillospiraceae bacterium]|nr:DUF4303 domain-containing protein [Oscillospiraceae bacterium]
MERYKKIYDALFNAAKNGFESLFKQHNENFYYCALIMMEVSTPCIAAISEESLQHVLDDNCADENEKNESIAEYKWSYADSPYCGYGFNEYFREVENLFNDDVWDENIEDDEYESRVSDWLKIMTEVMNDLDEKGVFNFCKDRSKLFINAELQPPEDTTNLENARKLNNNEMFSEWFEDNKEEYEFDDDE